MSFGIIVRPIPLAAAQITATGNFGINAAFPATNLASRQPKVVTQTNVRSSGSTITLVINIDLLADTAIDTIALMFTNCSSEATWLAYGATAAAGAITESAPNLIFTSTAFGMAPTTRELRRHALWTAATPVSRRYIRIIITDTLANAENLIRAGVPVIGQRIAPAYNFELGSGRRIDDRSQLRVLPGGETYVEEGGRVPLWRATWSNLTEAEMALIWSLLVEIGQSRPVLLVEDPDATAGQAERMHYGLLEGLDFHERVQLDKQRIDLRVRELV